MPPCGLRTNASRPPPRPASPWWALRRDPQMDRIFQRKGSEREHLEKIEPGTVFSVHPRNRFEHARGEIANDQHNQHPPHQHGVCHRW